MGVAAVSAVALVGAACSSVAGGDPDSGTLSVELTSAQFPSDSVARADISVMRVEGMMRDIDSSEAAQHFRASL